MEVSRREMAAATAREQRTARDKMKRMGERSCFKNVKSELKFKSENRIALRGGHPCREEVPRLVLELMINKAR